MDKAEKARLKILAGQKKESQERLETEILTSFSSGEFCGNAGIITLISSQAFALNKEHISIRELIQGMRLKYLQLSMEEIRTHLAMAIECGIIRIDEDNKVFIMPREAYE